MKFLRNILVYFSIFVLSGSVSAQHTPWFHWTFLPQDQMAEIIGEASGETAWNTIMETGGYNKDRLAGEYKTTFYEAQYIYDQLVKYGLDGAAIDRLPGGKVWDGIKGELWEINPLRQKLASYQDMTAMLVRGSSSANVTAQLIWVDQGSKSDLKGRNVSGKIVVTEGNLSAVHNLACLEKGALGVVGISQSRPAFDPLQIPWRGIRGSRNGKKPARFAFYLPFREGHFLKQRLLRGQKIKVHAVVESQELPYEYQLPVCFIPGTDPDAAEIIFSAHLFEGYVKQGANDNKSGSAGILEVARTLNTLIESGRLPRPKRTIRFLWGPEFSGTGPWVREHKELMNKTLCNINMDMVGEWLSKNQSFMCLMRTSYGNPHYINDVMENYFRFVGEGNRERIHRTDAPFPYKFPRRIVAPSGADEPFYYSIETHFGASDHEVFNDWGVQVPGIMMIAWPDQWYHTSGDRVDKADPTQLKRIVVIGAAAAYTIANADDNMAVKIASETAGNGARRLGHQLVRGFEELNQAGDNQLAKAYKQAVGYMTAAVRNEKATLETVMELTEDKTRMEKHVRVLKQSVESAGKAYLVSLRAHMEEVAVGRGVEPVAIQWTDKEKKAAGIYPKPTSLVKENGYRGYSKLVDKVPKMILKRFPFKRSNLGSASELQSLINGRNSILDIKIFLDAQYQKGSKLKDIRNFLEILKAAGLIEM